MRYVVDIETVSAADLRKVGVKRYAADPSTCISILSFINLDEGSDTNTYVHPILGGPSINEDQDMKALERFAKDISSGNAIICAHNATFERELLTAKLEEFLNEGFNLEGGVHSDTQWKCSMTYSYQNRGPGTLEKAAKYFGTEIEKDTEGGAIMRAVCKPTEELKTVRGITPELVEFRGHVYLAGRHIYKRMADYCATDVNATYLLIKKMQEQSTLGHFALVSHEGETMTAEMNANGVKLDMELLDKLKAAKDENERKLIDLCKREFGVTSPGMRTRILKRLQEAGSEIEKLGAADIAQALKEGRISAEFVEPLKEYAARNKTSLKKVDTAIDKQLNGRLYDLFRFCGAYATGRWSSVGFQLQNLPRPTKSFEESIKDLDNPENIVNCLRGLIVPDMKHYFFVTDLSQIELRMALLKGGYENAIQALHEGKDLYTQFAAAAYGKEEKNITSEERNMGKACMLSLQYGCGAKNLKNTCNTIWDGDITIEQAKHFVKVWRERYVEIVKLWNKYQGEIDKAAALQEDLEIKLRTGRTLLYKNIKKETLRTEEGYRTAYTYWDGMKRVIFWGGHVFQHTVQAECRDLLLLKMLGLRHKGHKIVMTVHDEVVVEVPKKTSLSEMQAEWDLAGEKAIKRLWPRLLLNSESKFAERYEK